MEGSTKTTWLPRPSADGMVWKQAAYAVALVLLLAGATIFVVGSVEMYQENVKEQACRAANDGLDELQCMNFGGISYSFAILWSVSLAGAGATLAALTWLVGRGGPPAREGSA